MSLVERTGWRDEALSRRHREWGFDCPMVDCDFIAVEFDHKEPVCLVDYKHEKKRLTAIDIKKDAGLVALSRLAERADIPAFIVRYSDNLAWFQVIPLNRQASDVCDVLPYWKMPESEYVTFLYRLRGREVPEAILIHIAREKSA